MKSRKYSKFIRVFTDPHKHLLTRELNPAYMRLGNESSPAFQRKIKAKKTDFQLYSPVMHRRNAGEWEIITFKHNFITRLCSTDPDSPM